MPDDLLLYSYREAARRLGISRNRGLHDLIAKGALRPVTINGVARIPRAQVEHLAAVGDEPQKQTRAKSKRPPTGTIADVQI